jgi:membrane-bound metal-dependent hydrolase YbcI (DUF457 family)
MAALVHAGIGLGITRWAPRVHVAVLVLSAYALDLIWHALCFVGIEHYPSPGPWSHGLFMSSVWSIIVVLVAWVSSRRFGTAVLIGVVVFSHWIVDFITHPMTALIPSDPGLALFFNESYGVGLGLYRSKLAFYLCEAGVLIPGAVIYLFTLKKLKQDGTRS